MENKKPYFPNLEGELVKRGIGRQELASVLGMTPRAAYNKIKGRSVLTWPDADRIQKNLFPDKDKDYLFSRTAR